MLLSSVVVLGFAGAVQAQTLMWDAPNDQTITGYIYKSGTQSGVYSASHDVGNVTSAMLIGLAPSTTYYFVVESYDAQGMLSVPSSEIVYTTPRAPLVLTCPAPVVPSSTGSSVSVALPLTVTGGLAPIATSCAPQSGALFPVGVTPFTCTATDAAQQAASCQSTVTVTGCAYSVTPTSQATGAGSGAGTATVNTTGSCAWTARANASWLAVTAGATGAGNGTVGYTFAANTDTTARTGTLNIAGQTLTVTQSGVPCTYSVTPTSQSVGAAGGTGTVAVTTGSSCTSAAMSNAGWLTVTTGASGTGDTTVAYAIAANTGTTTRTGTLTIAGQTLTVTQGGASSKRARHVRGG